MLIAAIRVYGREIPYCDSELSVGGESAVVDGQREPRIPDPSILEVLVRCLSVNSQRLRVGEWLDGNVQLRVGTQITAAMSQVRSLEEGRIWQWLLVALEPVAA